MRIVHFFGLAALALAATAAQAATLDAAPSNPPVRKRICQPCRLPAVPAFLPRHGMLLARSGVFSLGTTYVSVDLDTGQLVEHVEPTESRAGSLKPRRLAFTLKPEELASLEALINQLWAAPDPMRPGNATDVYWDAWLSDGDDVRHEHGPGNPTGVAEALDKRLADILGAYEHWPPRGA